MSCSVAPRRWSINSFAFLWNNTRAANRPADRASEPLYVPEFDEPYISMAWPRRTSAGRIGIVGESLMAHVQVSDAASVPLLVRRGRVATPADDPSLLVPSLPPQYTKQRVSKPDYGLREDVLLPWYSALADQYVRSPLDSWKGNATLIALYDQLARAAGEEKIGFW